jgi:phosphatidylglycerol---prolipoprotein diacylglyceryl transferase
VQQVAFQIGGITIHWYGVLIALGFIAGLWTASRRAPRSGISPDAVFDLGPILLVGAIIGSRALYVVSYWDRSFAGKPWYEPFMIHHGGLVFYGGLIAATLGGIIYARYRKLPIWRLADVLAPSIALGYAFGRIGCFMNGCCYGHTTDLPWNVHFPVGHDTHPHGVHPAQLYSTLLNFGLFLGLAWFYRHKRFDGQVFGLYLVSYAVLRSVAEMFRGDYPGYYAGWATPAHLVSVAILLAGLFLLWQLPRRSQQARGAGYG